ncbi:MAG: peroxiredoxin family protein [Ignavibacteria bacterium]|nr:peroxiredoxin family protein [Ignavibacteria bacterium]
MLLSFASSGRVACVGFDCAYPQSYLRDFRAQRQLCFPIVSDLPKEIFSGYSIVGSSTYLVIDDRGVVKYRANGFYEAAMSAKIKELL